MAFAWGKFAKSIRKKDRKSKAKKAVGAGLKGKTSGGRSNAWAAYVGAKKR
jgi:hypothetical protein